MSNDTVPERLAAPDISTGHPNAGREFATAFYKERARADALSAKMTEWEALMRDTKAILASELSYELFAKMAQHFKRIDAALERKA